MSTDQASLPQSLTLLIGPPRSGTTLIANAFMAHSTVTGVLEPYQRWRHEGFEEARMAEFLVANKLSKISKPFNLAVKETTTRLRNVELSLELLNSAKHHGIYRGLVIILRCPLTAYLSQVEASGKYWEEKKMTEETEASLSQWVISLRRSLQLLCRHARAQHFRIVCYERFCTDPAAELARLMALIPEPLEVGQLEFNVADKIQGKGDPKVHEKAGGISVTDRVDEINALKGKYVGNTDMNILLELQDVILNRVGQEADVLTLDRLTRLVI